MKRMIKTSLIIMLGFALYACNGKKTANTDNSVTPTEEAKTEEVKVASNEPLTAAAEGKVQHITSDQFATFVNDFRASNEYALKSELPCVVDFYADWCKPCKMIAPFLDELAIEYKGKVNILKINVDEQQEIADFYKIQAIPTMMFCPKKGNYVMEVGGSDKATIKNNIMKNVLK